MNRFYYTLAVLLLMALHASIVAALGANVVGFTIPPVVVFILVSFSPFLVLLTNGMPSLYSLMPGAPVTLSAPLTIPAAAAVDMATRVLAQAEPAMPAPAPATVVPPVA